jgi:hypothetical protein
MTPVFDSLAWDYFKPAKLFVGIWPPVRFDQAYHDIDAVAAPGLRRPQHFIGFPDTGGGA